jgi:hypothetical protein
MTVEFRYGPKSTLNNESTEVTSHTRLKFITKCKNPTPLFPDGTLLIEKYQNLAVKVKQHTITRISPDGTIEYSEFGYLIEPINYLKPSFSGRHFYSTAYIHLIYRPLEENDKALLV